MRRHGTRDEHVNTHVYLQRASALSVKDLTQNSPGKRSPRLFCLIPLRKLAYGTTFGVLGGWFLKSPAFTIVIFD